MDVTTHPVVDRFLRRLVALTPAQWDQLDADLAAWFTARGYRGEPHAALRWLAEYTGKALRLLPVPREAWQLLADRFRARDGFGQVAPAWRRQGVGPLRHLIELVQWPGRAYLTRIWLPGALHVVYHRATFGGDWQAEFYAPLERFIPWAELVDETMVRDDRGSLTGR